jgi:hypothetical protein
MFALAILAFSLIGAPDPLPLCYSPDLEFDLLAAYDANKSYSNII